MNLKQKISEKFWRFYRLPQRLDAVQEALGRIESRLMAGGATPQPMHMSEVEFKVYSQWGEDGIIDHLVRSIAIPNRTFVEFGVETYIEANTLFLLKHRHWNGLVIDGSQANIESIRRGNVFWKYELAADCAFITKDNIDQIITRNGISGDIGLLSVDIDGNDYWVWQAIGSIHPRIVVAEYNSLFGPTATVSVPYQSDFYRTTVHPSNMFYGASIAALAHLACQRGYTLVAGNSAGNNVFFVRDDCLGALRPLTPQQAYVQAGFRESRGADGSVQHLRFAERQSVIAGLDVIDVVSMRRAALREFVG